VFRLLNTLHMQSEVCEPRYNLSSAKSVGFRPGLELRAELDKLAAELSRPGVEVTLSEIIRDGVTAFWPQIRAYIRAKTQTGGLDPALLDRIVAAGTRAHQLGLSAEDIETTLAQALAAKLAGQ
jgi:hypothetical protein